ncbi:hypothetical protein D3C78_1816970 [compost metagenome]
MRRLAGPGMRFGLLRLGKARERGKCRSNDKEMGGSHGHGLQKEQGVEAIGYSRQVLAMCRKGRDLKARMCAIGPDT